MSVIDVALQIALIAGGYWAFRAAAREEAAEAKKAREEFVELASDTPEAGDALTYRRQEKARRRLRGRVRVSRWVRAWE